MSAALLQISSSNEGRWCLWDVKAGQLLREVSWKSPLTSICSLVSRLFADFIFQWEITDWSLDTWLDTDWTLDKCVFVCSGPVCDCWLCRGRTPCLDVGDLHRNLPHCCTQWAHSPLLCATKPRFTAQNNFLNCVVFHFVLKVFWFCPCFSSTRQDRATHCVHCIWRRHSAALETTGGQNSVRTTFKQCSYFIPFCHWMASEAW